jgi:toxin CcdB
MRQFDIVRLRGRQLAVVLQCGLLDDRTTRVVAPLFRTSSISPTPRLHPLVRIGRHEYLLATEKLAAVLKKDIEEVVGSMAGQEYEIRRAIDIVFIGV